MELSFMPSYNYKTKIAGFILLILSIIVFFFSKISNFSLIDSNISLWLIAFSLLIISFSKDKYESDDSVVMKYYAGKIASSFIFSFILATKITEFITDKLLSIDSVLLCIIAMSIYQLSYTIIKISSRKSKVSLKETSIMSSVDNNKNLFIITSIISVATLLILIFVI